MRECILVGTGAAGVAAALQAADRGIRPLVLDVGHRPRTPAAAVPDENLYDRRRREDTFPLYIGEDREGLTNLLTGNERPVKLNAPRMEFVTRDAARLGPLHEDRFHAIQSFAAGGLANAWGAGLYRFNDDDLRGFPVTAADLSPYLDRLTAEIGIAGAHDDLEPFFGRPEGLLPPLRLSRNVGALYRGYREHRSWFARRGIHVGQAHIGVLTEPRPGRATVDYSNAEMWAPTNAVYSPLQTLEKLIADDAVEYRKGVLVEGYREESEGILVTGRDLETGERVEERARYLVLAAGAINTTRIVLRANGDHHTRLRLLENPAVQIPFVMPRMIGRGLETDAWGLVQLNLVWDSAQHGTRLQGSLMEITSPLRAEFFGRFPYAARGNLALVRTMLPGMIVMQLFYPAGEDDVSWVSLEDEGRLRIEGPRPGLDLGALAPLAAAFRRMGAWTARGLMAPVPLGHAIHYAGTLPMRVDPGPYACDSHGLLHGTERVYVADSAGFPGLPAKNMSFSMMGNAMRVLQAAADRWGSDA